MRSDRMKKGIEKAPHRSLFQAMGYLREEIERPIIGIANSANELIPGHIHLDNICKAVKEGIRMAGATPMEFSTIGICDGIAMNHEGMKYSLGSRELICDSVEVMCKAYPFDGLVLIPNCDKIIPGMIMAAMRLNIPTILISGGPMLSGRFKGKRVDLISVFEGVGKVAGNLMTEEELLDKINRDIAIWKENQEIKQITIDQYDFAKEISENLDGDLSKFREKEAFNSSTDEEDKYYFEPVEN